jgi:hypothetical protein
MTTLTAEEFEQDPERALAAAQAGPVFITDRGLASHALLTIGAYQELARRSRKITDLLAMPEASDIEFDPD